MQTQKVCTASEGDLKAIQAAFEQLKGEHVTNLVGGIAYANADASDPNELASGQVLIFEGDAQVSHDLLPHSIGTYFMVAKLQPQEGKRYTDAQFQNPKARASLNANVVQYNPDPPSLSNRHPTGGHDTKPWGPELGREDGFVGVYKVMSENGRDADYYLATRVGLPDMAHELKSHVASSITMENLATDPHLGYLMYTGHRNAARVLHAAARALQVPITDAPDLVSSFVYTTLLI